MHASPARLSRTGPFPARVAAGVGYSWLAGLVVSGFVYRAFSRALSLTAGQAAIQASDLELEAMNE